jgi:hypothetical protein
VVGEYLDTVPDGGRGDPVVRVRIETDLWQLKIFSVAVCGCYRIVNR